MIAKELESGTLIRYKNEVYTILEAKYIKPGNGAGYVETKMRMIRDGRVLRKIFAPSVQLEEVKKESVNAKLVSHADGTSLFEHLDGKQVSIPHRVSGKVVHFLPEGSSAMLNYYDGELLDIALPKTSTLLVKDTIDGKALLETGVAIKVPPHIKQGDTVIVNMADGKFLFKKK